MLKITLFDCLVGIFYYSLGNLHPRLRSTLPSIQVVAVAKAKIVVTYGIDTILDPFMADIRKLEEVHVNQDKNVVKFNFKFAFILYRTQEYHLR